VIYIASEDEISETIIRTLLKESGYKFTIQNSFREGGNGYLKNNLEKFCNLAKRSPVLLLTDLDTNPCPIYLKQKWLGKIKPPENLLFRVAVKEIEAWLIADHDAIQKLLGKNITKLPADADKIDNPKKFLIDLAKKSNRLVRDGFVQEKNAIASQGIAYNEILCKFVEKEWSPKRAAWNSESLRRTYKRIKELADYTEN